jgi:hypothetical protein
MLHAACTHGEAAKHKWLTDMSGALEEEREVKPYIH